MYNPVRFFAAERANQPGPSEKNDGLRESSARLSIREPKQLIYDTVNES
jgi:hypothetical protein